MVWTPPTNDPSAVFIKPVLNNALAIVRRDFKNALDYYFAGEHKPDFREHAKGMVKGLVFPCFAVSPLDVDTLAADDNSHIVVSVSFASHIGVTGKDDSEVTDLIMDYTGVLDGVYRTAFRELCDDISNPFEIYLKLRHEYGPRGMNKEQTLYFRSSLIEATLNFRQR